MDWTVNEFLEALVEDTQNPSVLATLHTEAINIREQLGLRESESPLRVINHAAQAEMIEQHTGWRSKGKDNALGMALISQDGRGVVLIDTSNASSNTSSMVLTLAHEMRHVYQGIKSPNREAYAAQAAAEKRAARGMTLGFMGYLVDQGEYDANLYALQYALEELDMNATDFFNDGTIKVANYLRRQVLARESNGMLWVMAKHYGAATILGAKILISHAMREHLPPEIYQGDSTWVEETVPIKIELPNVP